MVRTAQDGGAAIELAAGRAGSHGIAATADLLNKNLGLDWHGRRTALPRHQTLRALLDWSYGLLPDAEQLALRRLSVLVGAFTLEAACAIVHGGPADEAAMLNTLDALVAKSLMSTLAGAQLATGYTEHICVDLAGHMARIPQPMMDRFIVGVERMTLPAGSLLIGG